MLAITLTAPPQSEQVKMSLLNTRFNPCAHVWAGAAREQKEATLWHFLGERPRYRWQQAVERWLIESPGCASLEDLELHLRGVHRHLYDKYLDTIDRT